MKIILKTKKWYSKDKIYFKGFFFWKNKLYRGIEAIDIIFSNLERIEEFLRKLNGNYTIVINDSNKIILVSDLLRTTPLLYSLEEKMITDDISIFKNLNLDCINTELFLLSGFVQGKETLFNNISQVEAGEIVILKSDTIKKNKYFELSYKKILNKTLEEKIKKLDVVHIEVFKRLIRTLDNRRVVIPLSGGQDSRLVAVMLKRLNYENVICFSYGKFGNIESKISKEIAEYLGYKWYFIEYDREFENILKDRECIKYEEFAGQGVSLPHIQDFYAVKKLKEKNILKEEDVFIPGHTYDFLTGGHLLEEFFEKNYKFTKENLISEIIKKHYILWPNRKNLKKIKEKILKNYIKDDFIEKKDCFIEVLDKFNMNERQAKFIVNSIKVYEYFGYEWRIPLWDLELIKFWEKIPFEEKLNRNFYFNYTSNIEILSELTRYDLNNKINECKIKKVLKKIIKRNYYFYEVLKRGRKIINYRKHILNFDGIQSRLDYLYNIIKGQESINSYLVKEYIKNIKGKSNGKKWN